MAFEISFYPALPIINTPMDNSIIVVAEGTNVSVACEATGYPTPTVIWSKTNGALSDRVLISDNSSRNGSVLVPLTIINASEEDTGVYICTAKNSIGTDRRNVKIICKYIVLFMWPYCMPVLDGCKNKN